MNYDNIRTAIIKSLIELETSKVSIGNVVSFSISSFSDGAYYEVSFSKYEGHSSETYYYTFRSNYPEDVEKTYYKDGEEISKEFRTIEAGYKDLSYEFRKLGVDLDDFI